MYDLNKIRAIHVELSTECNASCPVCNRNLYGGKSHPWLPKAQIFFDDFKKFFPEDFIAQLDFVLFCGNYGDPLMSRDLVRIVEYIYTCNRDITIQINTNGGGRSNEFWSQLGKMIKAPSNITFSIDGLEDTNHIYRRGVKWDNVMRSLEAFISSGGNAHWDFLVFEHNEHQLEDAKSFAKELGVNNFIPKKAFGFTSKGNIHSISVYDQDSNFDYNIYPPNPYYQNRQIGIEKKNNSRDNSNNSFIGQSSVHYTSVNELNKIDPPSLDQEYKAKLSHQKIDCYSLKENELFISAEGLVFPCCFTASRLYGLNKKDFVNWQFQKHTQSYSRSTFSLHESSLETVIKSEFLNSSFQNSWSCKDLDSGKLAICSEFCGTNSVELESVFDLKDVKTSKDKNKTVTINSRFVDILKNLFNIK